MNNKSLLTAWARQQKDLGMPDPVLEKGAAFMNSLRAPALQGGVPAREPAQQVETVSTGAIPARQPAKTSSAPSRLASPFSRLSKISPIAKVQRNSAGSVASAFNAPQPPQREPEMPQGQLTFEKKRAMFKDLYAARCDKCHLAQSRKSFVFGAGNVDAGLMIIGEAPGQEEDAQGLPFVGPAGKLLSEMLAAVGIDRKKDVFITNILKCRPPGNRNPESAEILMCLPLLEKQITVIRPKLLLLLGRIAAHSLLNSTDSISKMRGKEHLFRGIPAVVTYHPAAILRTMEYRTPTDEDFKKIAAMLKESSNNGDS